MIVDDNNEALLNWRNSPDGRRSKAQGTDGEYRIGRYDAVGRPWPEAGIPRTPDETWFEVRLHVPGEKRPRRLIGYLDRIDTMEAAKALAQAHNDKTK
jgi:hypothetical protein